MNIKWDTKKAIYFFTIIVTLILSSCSLPLKKERVASEVEKLKNEYPYLYDYIDKAAKMDIVSRRGLLSMVGIKDKTLTKETIKILKENKVYGIVLFNYNIVNEKQLKTLTSDIRKYINPNMLISIDQEGGEVYRISFDNTKKISAREIGEKNDAKYAYKIAYNRAKFLLGLGINVILGPVCDIAKSEKSYMYNRSFSTNQKIVSDMVYATVKAQHDAGIISVLKHFPGHGDTKADSHKKIPVINKEIEELKNRDFLPFISGINAGAEMILMAHIKNRYIDKQYPASMSLKYGQILYEKLGFKGIVITDDLVMTGKVDSAIDFGINLISDTYDKAKSILTNVSPDLLTCAKILKIIDDHKIRYTNDSK